MLGLFGSRRTAVFLVSWARALLHYWAWVWRYCNGIIDDSWHRPSLVCDSATQLSPTLTVYRRQQLSSETLYGDVRDAESLLRLPKHVHGVVVVVVSIVVVVVVFVVVRRTCLCRSQLRQVNNLLIFLDSNKQRFTIIYIILLTDADYMARQIGTKVNLNWTFQVCRTWTDFTV